MNVFNKKGKKQKENLNRWGLPEGWEFPPDWTIEDGGEPKPDWEEKVGDFHYAYFLVRQKGWNNRVRFYVERRGFTVMNLTHDYWYLVKKPLASPA